MKMCTGGRRTAREREEGEVREGGRGPEGSFNYLLMC